ncbi:MAG TPA: hypothetical protein VIR27_14185 [Mycobacteriales bacterium]
MWQLTWWAIFLIPTLTAVVWALWRKYPGVSRDGFDSVARHRRFVRALSRAARPEDSASAPKDTDDVEES